MSLTFVKASGHVASRRAQQNPEDHSASHESPSVGRWQETQAGQDYSRQIINALIHIDGIPLQPYSKHVLEKSPVRTYSCIEILKQARQLFILDSSRMEKIQQQRIRSYTASECEKTLTECDECHDEDLRALSQEHRQQHALPGRSEHITVHLFPPWLFLCILLGRNKHNKRSPRSWMCSVFAKVKTNQPPATNSRLKLCRKEKYGEDLGTSGKI